MDFREMSNRITSMVSEIAKSVVTVYTMIPEISLFFGPRLLQGAGSGFIAKKGIVVTNAHVVARAKEISIVFSDGSSSKGWLRAIDTMRDLAIIETDTDLPPLRMGDSDTVRIGEIVFAVGSPLGLTGTSVSMGVISAIGRIIIDEANGIYLDDLLQTDAAINPGNSGGPIVSCEGEVIGIATAIIPFAQGIGFAIPVNSVKRFLSMIEKYGRPIKAWIGVLVAPLNPSISQMYGIPQKEGLIVVQVIPRSPAALKGIRPGDVIIEASGRKLVKASDLRNAIEDSYGSDCIDLKIYREGDLFEVCVPLIVE
ncbi:MAG: serine protease [Thermoproteota archaeon]|uniref:PDZ domain-containing protein n=1 Tax=Candidatus Methanodesulfokora washburnensis TaxID=2478471 RepID=A0A429GH67_9CREN|nr:trypsin-like peptidase domain-containing protein [Candidatus Methanodesulfokores washburnensis]RSN73039.1 PDZ domain-containing protein [Candidatus Methanodesulfokores washburnensis]TDA41962.1 MAG: serine protease [Candidatus Korarchaeota archaeon]